MSPSRRRYSSRLEKLGLFSVVGFLLIVLLELVSLDRSLPGLLTVRAFIGIGFFVLVYTLVAMLFYILLRKVVQKRLALMVVIVSVTVLMIWFYSLLLWLGFFSK